jgi:hypothetical protein
MTQRGERVFEKLVYTGNFVFFTNQKVRCYVQGNPSNYPSLSQQQQQKVITPKIMCC